MRCHRTFGMKGAVLNDIARSRNQDPEWGTCIGTGCPLWVPEVKVGGRVGVRARRGEFTLAGDQSGAGVVLLVPAKEETATGRGVCADNLGATPFVPYTASVPHVAKGEP